MNRENTTFPELDDELLTLAAMGLLELEGRALRAEFRAWQEQAAPGCAGSVPAEEAQPVYPVGNTVLPGLRRVPALGVTSRREDDEVRPLTQKRPGPPPERVRQLEQVLRWSRLRAGARRVWRVAAPVVTGAAALFLVFLLGVSAVLITSADAREYLYNLVFTVHERYSEVYIPEDPAQVESWDPAEYRINFIPEGYELEQHEGTGELNAYIYFNPDGDFITIEIHYLNPKYEFTARFDTEDADSIETVTIGSSSGLKIIKDGATQIVWQNEDAFFSVFSRLPSETVVQIAESILPVE